MTILFIGILPQRLKKGAQLGPPFLFIEQPVAFHQKLGNGKTPRTRQKIVITIVVEKAHQKMNRW